MHGTGTYKACTGARCATISAKIHAPDKQHIYECGRPPNHLWFSSQADLTSKSGLDPNGGLVKDLIMP
jgi:hypothetical protein